MKIVVYFSGQGIKITSEVLEYIERFKITEKIYEIYKDTLGHDIRKQLLLGKSELTQPMIIAINHIIWEILKLSRMPEPKVIAGHSLGEYSALAASGVISIREAISLVYLREKYMRMSCIGFNSGMAAVIGTSLLECNSICSQSKIASEVLDVACINTKNQVVISGHRNSIDKAILFAKANKRTARRIKVNVPSHSSLMRKAAFQFEQVLESIDMRNPKIPIMRNVDAKIHLNKDEIKDSLVKQLTHPVQWVETIYSAEKLCINLVVECGHGNILRDFSYRTLPFNCSKLTCFNIIKTIFDRI